MIAIEALDTVPGIRSNEDSRKIEKSSALSEAEIERMRKDAEEHAGEDKRRKELAEARNQADHLCHQLEKLMTEHKDKLRDSDKEPLTKAITKARETAKLEDIDQIKSAVRELEEAQQAFSKVLYERTGAAGGASAAAGDAAAQAGGPSPTPNDDAIDAEFEVKKDK